METENEWTRRLASLERAAGSLEAETRAIRATLDKKTEEVGSLKSAVKHAHQREQSAVAAAEAAKHARPVIPLPHSDSYEQSTRE